MEAYWQGGSIICEFFSVFVLLCFQRAPPPMGLGYFLNQKKNPSI